jgi:signal transduction histidine kinase
MNNHAFAPLVHKLGKIDGQGDCLALVTSLSESNFLISIRYEKNENQHESILALNSPHKHNGSTNSDHPKKRQKKKSLASNGAKVSDLPQKESMPLAMERRRSNGRTAEAAQHIEELENLAQLLIESREQEQQEISRELHDNIAQVLSAATARISLAREEPIPAWLRQELLDLREHLMHALEDVRHLARNLRPAILDHHGFRATLAKHAEDFRQRNSVQIELRIDPDAVEFFDQHHLTHLFRLAQEAMQNIEDHACADRAWINIVPHEDGLLLEIGDNGRGFTPERVIEAQADGHLGLLGMRERAELMGGQFILESMPKNGTTIRVSVPPPAEINSESSP